MTDTQLKIANGKCRSWDARSFRSCEFQEGASFSCNACGKRLRTTKVSMGLVVAVFALASYLGEEFGFLAVLGVLILLVIYEWLTVQVTIAGDAKVVASS